MKKSFLLIKKIAISLLLSVILISGLIVLNYITNPTCEAFIGEYETWKCSFTEYVYEFQTIVTIILGIPVLTIIFTSFWIIFNIFRKNRT